MPAKIDNKANNVIKIRPINLNENLIQHKEEEKKLLELPFCGGKHDFDEYK